MPQRPKLDGQMLFSERSGLPEISCVYFVFTSDPIFYIGRSKNLFQRFKTHNRKAQFKKLGDSLTVGWIGAGIDKIGEIEIDFIGKFSPRLNGKRRPQRKRMVSTGISLPTNLLIAGRERAKEMDRSFSWLVKQALVNHLLDAQAMQAVATCGIGGIYADFQSPADAIQQMAEYIQERGETVPMDVLEIDAG